MLAQLKGVKQGVVLCPVFFLGNADESRLLVIKQSRVAPLVARSTGMLSQQFAGKESSHGCMVWCVTQWFCLGQKEAGLLLE